MSQHLSQSLQQVPSHTEHAQSHQTPRCISSSWHCTAVPLDEPVILYYKQTPHFYTKTPEVIQQSTWLQPQHTLSQLKKVPTPLPDNFSKLTHELGCRAGWSIAKSVFGLNRSWTAAETLTGSEREGGAPTPQGISHHIPNMSSMDNERWMLCKRALLRWLVMSPTPYMAENGAGLVWTLRRRGSSQGGRLLAISSPELFPFFSPTGEEGSVGSSWQNFSWFEMTC